MGPRLVHKMDSRYQWIYFLRDPERNCTAVLKPFLGCGIILDLKVATVIIEVLVTLITDFPNATGSRMVSD